MLLEPNFSSVSADMQYTIQWGVFPDIQAGSAYIVPFDMFYYIIRKEKLLVFIMFHWFFVQIIWFLTL